MSVANFIPTLWSARLLEHLDKDHVYVNLLNRDYEGEIKNFGDTVKVNQLGDVTIGDYEANGTISDPEQLTGEQQTLTIDQAKYFNFMIDDIDDAQTNPKLMDSAMERAAYGLADVSDQYAANLLAVNVSSDNIIGSDDAAETVTSANAYEYLVQLGVKLYASNSDVVLIP
ncbi:MAG: hypothetical protein LUF02_00420 [Erysipelotrichaceae bacterium]|nr:hypothetical protein [Erysipelotrichaceae bacterium]